MREASVGVLMRNKLILACQRKRGSRYELKWEFPGGKLEQGETARGALVRELREELGIKVTSAELFHTQEWNYKDSPDGSAEVQYRIFYFQIKEFVGEPTNETFETIRWVSLPELKSLDMLEGNRDAVDILGISIR
jgi:8-oxo-dGTP diphosphatase